jgi:hypothetical protein
LSLSVRDETEIPRRCRLFVPQREGFPGLLCADWHTVTTFRTKKQPNATPARSTRSLVRYSQAEVLRRSIRYVLPAIVEDGPMTWLTTKAAFPPVPVIGM